MKPNSQNGFTFLRLLAAGLVIYTHSHVVLGLGPDVLMQASGLTELSGLGVDMFFAISGYLICQSLLRQPDSVQYVVNRCLRIFPALAVLVGVTVLILGPLFTTSPHYFSESGVLDYAWNVTGFHLSPWLPGVFAGNPVSVVNGSLWTIALEITCYGLLLLLAWCRGLNPRMLGALACTLLILHLNDVTTRDNYIFRLSAFYLIRLGALFFIGAFLASLGDRVRYSWAALALSFGGLLASVYWGQQDWHHFAAIYLLLWPFFIIGLAWQLPLLAWMNRFDCSYGMYLYGYVVQQAIVKILGRDQSVWQVTLVAISITLPLALLSWFLVEKPMIQKKAVCAAIIHSWLAQMRPILSRLLRT